MTNYSLSDWGQELLEQIRPYAEILDSAYGVDNHTAAVQAQQIKFTDSEQTPSAQLLQHLRAENISLHDYSLRQSLQHRDTLRATPMSGALQEEYQNLAAQSLLEQQQIEQSDTEDFTSYVARYHAALKKP